MTATHFPSYGLTFAILFGCPMSIEEDIIKRLSFAVTAAAHPVLLPGIFAELERRRHVELVEAQINQLENKIFELDNQSGYAEHTSSEETETRNKEKREAYLDTSYLKNGLVSWNTQLSKMAKHTEELDVVLYTSPILRCSEVSHSAAYDSQMKRTGRKIRDRFQAIINEYEDKIRDCTMRLDGMAMATQWVHTITSATKNQLRGRC